ncbi:ANM_collapsed_G0054440.mRNA.1.CDS.1 [Saccharomyces cerevisiae]|nr:ANM_collapsed_G0054440.mRNA.1.CDS.1 [Saccharomyces cerevisiae]
MSGRQIKELYYKAWQLAESKIEVLQYFLNWDEKVLEEWEAKRRYGLCGSARESWSFSAFAFHDELDRSPQYVKLQFSRHHRQLRSRYELSSECACEISLCWELPHLKCRIDGIPVDADRAVLQRNISAETGISFGADFEVWLLPHWADLANVEVLAADNTRGTAVHAGW